VKERRDETISGKECLSPFFSLSREKTKLEEARLAYKNAKQQLPHYGTRQKQKLGLNTTK